MLLKIKGNIGHDTTFEDVSRAVAEAKPPIVVLFDSGGGSLSESGRIAKLLATIRPTGVINKACSGAALIAFAGCGFLIAAKDAELMVHDVWSPRENLTAEDRQSLDESSEHIAWLMAQRSHLSPAEVRKLMRKESTIKPEDALLFGLVNKVRDY